MNNLFVNKPQCAGCGACSEICPQKAISMVEDSEGFLYPKINENLCVGCQKCVSVCLAKSPIPKAKKAFFLVQCKDEDVLKSSTSGGFFTFVAAKTVEEGGIVCGAKFDEKFYVNHVVSKDFAPMRKSKYVQSDMKECFKSVCENLSAGTKVLFTGTPCQCHALLNYIDAAGCSGFRSKLTVMSLICRGVMSPMLWREYVDYISNGGALLSYDFRDKTTDNEGHTVLYRVDDKEYHQVMQKDPFSRIYLKNLAFRPSCYSCNYCDAQNDFDYIVGDYFDNNDSRTEFAAGKGISYVIAKNDELLSADDFRRLYIVTKVNESDIKKDALQAPAKLTLLNKLLMNDLARKDETGHCDMQLILKKYGA